VTSEVVAEIEAQVRQLRTTGQVPPGLEDELDKCFEEVAEASLAGEGSMTVHGSGLSAGNPIAGFAVPMRLAQLRTQATTMARQRWGPSFRRLERRAALGAARLGEAASIRVHVTVDHLERLAARSPGLRVSSRQLGPVSRLRRLPGRCTRRSKARSWPGFSSA